MSTYQSICPRCRLSFTSGVMIAAQLCNSCIQTESLERMNAERTERDIEDARRSELEHYRRERDRRREEHEHELQRFESSRNRNVVAPHETYSRPYSEPRMMSRFESIMNDRWDEWRNDHERLKQLEDKYYSFSRPEVKKSLTDFRDGEMRCMQHPASYLSARVVLFISMLMIFTTPFFFLASQFLIGALWLTGGVAFGMIVVALFSNRKE